MKWLMKNTSVLLNCVFLQALFIVKTQPQNVVNLFSGPNLANQNPVISMGCFSDYILKSREISEGYSQDYNRCLLEAKADRQATDHKMLEKRLAITDSSQDVCKRLSICDSLNVTLEVFHCHALIGANNTKDVYSISGNASEYGSVLQENYRQIDLRHEQCSKMSERKYVEATGVNYRKLQSCLDGRSKPTSSITTTTTTTAANILNKPKTSLNRNSPPVGAIKIETAAESLNTTSLPAYQD